MMFLLPKYVAKKYAPYITPIIITVTTADGNKSSLLAKPDISSIANCIPNTECIIAKISGTPKILQFV